MRTLILAAGGIIAASLALLVLIVPTMPKVKAKAPDPRYSAGAISTTTVRDVQDYTVLISQEGMDGRWRGTGILLDATTVLTCAHIMPKDKSAKNLWIYPFPGDKVVKANLKFINYPQDLALLELTTPVTGHKVPTFAKAVRLGEPIISVGNISGYMMWFASYGIISGEHGRWVLSDAMIRGGNSGGPWANANGEIVALTDVGWFDDEEPGAIAGGVPVQELEKFLTKSKLKKPDTVYALTGE